MLSKKLIIRIEPSSQQPDSPSFENRNFEHSLTVGQWDWVPEAEWPSSAKIKDSNEGDPSCRMKI